MRPVDLMAENWLRIKGLWQIFFDHNLQTKAKVVPINWIAIFKFWKKSLLEEVSNHSTCFLRLSYKLQFFISDLYKRLMEQKRQFGWASESTESRASARNFFGKASIGFFQWWTQGFCREDNSGEISFYQLWKQDKQISAKWLIAKYKCSKRRWSFGQSLPPSDVHVHNDT